MDPATSEKIDQIFEKTKAKFGFVPNVMREMAKSPALLQAYVSTQAALRDSALTPRQLQAVQLAISERNGCDYCTAAHGAAAKMAGVTPETVDAIKSAAELQDHDVGPYVHAARLLTDKGGHLTPDDIASLESIGIDRVRLYDIIAIAGAKLMTNWTNHIGKTQLDPQFGGRGEK